MNIVSDNKLIIANVFYELRDEFSYTFILVRIKIFWLKNKWKYRYCTLY